MATKKAQSAKYTGRMNRLAAVVVGLAKVAGAKMAQPDLDARRRALLERQLLKAYEALWTTWTWSTVRTAIVQAIQNPSDRLRKGDWSEAFALRMAIEGITGALNDRMAPPELSGRVPKKELVLACLRAPAPRKGKPKGGAQSSSAALLALLKDLNISGASDSASINRMIARKSKSRAR